MIRDRSESIGWCCAAAVVIIFVAGLLVAVRDPPGPAGRRPRVP